MAKGQAGTGVTRAMAPWGWNTESFNRKIERKSTDECWAWLGSTSPFGPLFGVFKQQPDGTYHPQMTQARRILWAEHTGTYLGSRQSVYHTCGNKFCMNFLHLTTTRPTKDVRVNYKKPPGRTAGSRVINGRVYTPNQLERWGNELAIGAN